MSSVKKAGDQQFKEGDLFGAIQSYTRALDPLSSEVLTKVEKRLVLSNRALARLKYGAINEAQADCVLGLSPEYNDENADKGITAKLYLRRAKVRQILTEYEQARDDYEEFVSLQSATGRPVTAADAEVMKEIQAGLDLPESSAEMKRVKLIRAIQARGLFIDMEARKTFPTDVVSRSETTTSFADDSPGEDYLTTPLLIPVLFSFPKLEDPQNTSRSFMRKSIVSEHEPVGSYVQSMIQTYIVNSGPNRAWILKALEHESEKDAQVLIITKNGRLMSIPWDTQIADIWAGARWPRSTPVPFKVLRNPPAADPERFDGMLYQNGSFVTIIVAPKAQLQAVIQQVDIMLNDCGS